MTTFTDIKETQIMSISLYLQINLQRDYKHFLGLAAALVI